MKILSILGARPQFVKAAPIFRLQEEKLFEHKLVHTGQHYDYEMSKIFFDELGLPDPDYHLEVGSGSHGEQTGEILKRVEGVLVKEKPEWVIVYGDTNSTLAGALAATKLHIPVAHIEAGLRSFNRRMPEEINRVMTDHISSLLCCPTATAITNLQTEGFRNIAQGGCLISEHKLYITQPLSSKPSGYPLVINTGDLMYDSYLLCQQIANRHSKIVENLQLTTDNYLLATVHRAENTNNLRCLQDIIEAFCQLSTHLPIIWPLHPRTRKILEEHNLMEKIKRFPMIRLIGAVGYFDMLALEQGAKVILTDSGGVQKEAFFAEVPCITLREESEWVELSDHGFNRLVGTDVTKIVQETLRCGNEKMNWDKFFYGDGKAALKIIKACCSMEQ